MIECTPMLLEYSSASCSVFDYTYLLFWNSFWTIAPVIGIGLFDRLAGMRQRVCRFRTWLTQIIESEILMAFPQLYRFGREGHWFGMKLFSVYMLDGIYQVKHFSACPSMKLCSQRYSPVCHHILYRVIYILLPDFSTGWI